jgi:hypothetical protein
MGVDSGSNAAAPNMIWVFGDQHRGQALAYAGDPNVSTPNLDRMAANGIAFTGAVAGFPPCCPYRGALISGRYPHECVPGHGDSIDRPWRGLVTTAGWKYVSVRVRGGERHEDRPRRYMPLRGCGRPF